MVTSTAAQTNLYYFPQMTFKQQGEYICKYWYVTPDAIFSLAVEVLMQVP